jgi:hypothetical protein
MENLSYNIFAMELIIVSKINLIKKIFVSNF